YGLMYSQDLSEEIYNPGESIYSDEDDGCSKLKVKENKGNLKMVRNLPPPLSREEEDRRLAEFLKKTNDDWHWRMTWKAPRDG
ncbi:hypothetical protein KI387_035975, partial [Taxus chinensis]